MSSGSTPWVLTRWFRKSSQSADAGHEESCEWCSETLVMGRLGFRVIEHADNEHASALGRSYTAIPGPATPSCCFQRRPVGHSLPAWLERDFWVSNRGASTLFPISEGTDPLSLLTTSGAGLPMAWATMEADNARHDGTQDHRAAVGSGSSPRRPEVRHRAARW